MPSLADTAKDNGLSGWGYYLSGNQFDSADDSYAQDFLSRLHKYDPSAHFEQVASVLGNGGEGGGGGPAAYELRYDKTKLPGGDHPAMVDMNAGAYAGFRKDPNAGYAGNLFDRDAVGQDRNGYGTTTSPRNMNLAADHNGGWLDYSPMLIALIASMGAAAPALMAGNATLGSFSTGLGGSLANGIAGGARALGNGGGAMSLLPMLAQFGGSYAGINPAITSAGTSLARLAQRGRGPGG